MPMDLKRKTNIVKGILILLIVAYVGLSLLDCTMSVRTVDVDVKYQDDLRLPLYHNNFSWGLVVAAALQILLVFMKCYRLQILPALASFWCGLGIPLYTYANNEILEKMDFVTGKPLHTLRILPMGWFVFGYAILLFAASIFAAIWLNRQKLVLLAGK